MSYLIVLRYDSAGTCPVVLREDDQLMSSDGARWRLVAQTDDPDLAARIVEQLHARRPSAAPVDGRALPSRVARLTLPPRPGPRDATS